MFNLFKKDTKDKPLDVKIVREQILQFVKEELQRLEGGEGAQVKTLQLLASPAPEERHLFEAALYMAEPEKLKHEIQRIADNFALDLPEEWQLETGIIPALPAQMVKHAKLPLGLIIKVPVVETKPDPVQETGATAAEITVMSGKADQERYVLHHTDGRINLGREKNTQTSDGAIRTNAIAFPEDPEYPGNRYISRQHAHLEWDAKKNGFMLFADEGGIPPGNKTKVKAQGDEDPIRLNSAEVGYLLKDGDQIILGESIVLQFNHRLS